MEAPEGKHMNKLLTVDDISSILCIGKTNTYKLVRKKDLDDYLTKYLKSTINL